MTLDALLEGFPVVITVPVSWGDMDAFQHVNNTRFFKYFEDARIAWFERTGLVDLGAGASGVGPVIGQTSCRYHAPLHYPDDLHVGARVIRVGTHAFEMEYRVVSVALHAVAATGHAVIVAYDFDRETKAVLPESWRRALSHVENCDLPRATGDEGLVGPEDTRSMGGDQPED